MSGYPRSRGSLRRLRLGLVLGLGALAFALTLWSQLVGQTPSTSFSPTIMAHFTATNKLVVAVTETPVPAPAAKLRVQLLDDKGKEIAGPGVAQPRGGLAFNVDKSQAAGLVVICKRGNEQVKVPLNDVLLVKGHETSLFLGGRYFAGSEAPFRIDVHGVKTPRETLPLVAAEVEVQLSDSNGKKRTLYRGRTGANGRVEDRLQVPELAAGRYTMQVVTRSPLGEQTLTQAVEIKAGAKILLVSDKPIYQPGQMMHLRALALRPFDLHPVGQSPVVFEVEDSKGNKVFKRTLKTSDFGVASIDFQLASEVNMGDYNIRAIIGQNRAEKTVTVKRYVLPKFKVNVTTNKQFYLPEETVEAKLQSDYFFGKPVSGAKVKVTAHTFDIRFRQFQVWEGKTDKNGHVEFKVKLPNYFVGQPLQKGNAMVKLDIAVTDTADHTENVTKTRTVSAQPIQVSLIPEGGKIIPGVENRLFVAAVYPDGSPARCDVDVWRGQDKKTVLGKVKTNDAGLAEIKVKPAASDFRRGRNRTQSVEMLGGTQQRWMPEVLYDVQVQASDMQGNKAATKVTLNSHPLGENVLLRLNKAVYKSAEKMNVDIRTSAGLPTVYLDIVRGGQIVLSKWLDVKNGGATHTVDVPQDIFGSLEIHAYQMLGSGEIIRDSRIVYVHPRNDLNVEVKANSEVFLPGENGRIRFVVTDKNGKGTAAALGVIIVDEAVYALQDMQPGLEKVYFTLQEELLKPQAQVLKYSPPENLNALVRQPALPAPKQQIAEVLLTSVKVQPPARWQVAPAELRRHRYEQQVKHLGWGLYNHAWFGRDTIQYDEAKGKWSLKTNTLNTVASYGYGVNDPLGQRISFERLQKTEKNFSLDHLAQAITHHRLEKLAEALVTYTNKNKKDYFKNGRWQLTEVVLLKAAQDSKLPDTFFRDAWGQGLRLVTSTSKFANRTGHTQFDHYQLVSAGADRDYRTADDMDWSKVCKDTSVRGWWNNPDQQVVASLALRDPNSLYKARNPNAWRFQNGKLAERERLMNQIRRNMDMPGQPPMAPGAARPGFGRGGGGAKGGRGGFGGKRAKAKNGAFDRFDAKEERTADDGSSGGSGGPAIRVREYFPETMLWQPALITNDQGIADLAVNFADSITTWRLSASANSRGGALGSTTVPLKVFQDFFVDIDLPVTLTQNDEVAFPVAIYNYLKTPQTVKLQLQKESWFTLMDGEGFTRSVKLKPNEVTSIKYRVKVHRIGHQSLLVKAFGSKKNDAVRRIIEVVPDGKKMEAVVSDRLKGKVAHTIDIPEDAIPDSSKLIVRMYPGVMAQVMEGMDSMLRLPGG